MTPRAPRLRAACLALALAACAGDDPGRVVAPTAEPPTAPAATPPEAPAPPAPTAATDAPPAPPAPDPIGASLEEAASRYDVVAREGRWPTLPADTRLAPGDVDPVVRDVRRVLALTGDLASDGSASGAADRYDDVVVGAVRSFQERHGLTPDGVVGPDTVAAMRFSPAERAEALRETAQQWQTLDADGADRMILVNLGEYVLRALEGGEEVEEMAVVVGAEFDDRATPTFHDELEYVIFGPAWNVPTSIAVEELLPEGYDALQARGFQVWIDGDVVPLTPARLDSIEAGTALLRQPPGGDNPLGRVKFMFPNEHAVYLHDTPATELFEQEVREFSHGCIRVEDPGALATWLLSPMGWTRQEVAAAMGESTDRQVDLAQPVPVHIVDWPAFADADGEVRFARELYLPA